MEKLSVEEKAKLYDEALKKAKDCQFDGLTLSQPVRDVIEYIFPELKESEDERIRKWLIDTIKTVPNDSIEWSVIDKSDVLAWLEKQKETTTSSDEASSNKSTNTKNVKKKYILTDETIEYHGHKLYRIKTIKGFGAIRKGSLGGWVESEDNLSQEGDCWIFDEAKVFGKAIVYEDAIVHGNASVYGNARVYGDANISGNAQVYGNVYIYGNVLISEYAKVLGSININGYADFRGEAEIKFTKDYAVFKNIGNSSNYFTWTRSNNMWATKNFYGTGEELIKRGGKYYEAIIKAQEEILKLSK